jgi:N-acetylated-alpha-linked acidic dipeptidase
MWPAILLASVAVQDAPPARQLLLELTEATRLAGTRGSRLAADRCARRLEEAGFEVEIDQREVVQVLPLRTHLRAEAEGTLLFERHSAFDPEAIPTGDVPLLNSGTRSGRVRAPVVDVGRGLREDYARLAAAGVDVRGMIALCRYGGAYRGVKIDLAAEHGCAGVLLWNDPARDGFERGTPWPRGPWKPAHEAERGSVTPIGRVPGDPSTPDGPSMPPPAARREPDARRELDARSGDGARRERGAAPEHGGAELERALSRLPCLPIGAGDARSLLARMERRGEGLFGPGPALVEFEVHAPPRRVVLFNVVARLAGRDARFVLAGNHRDAWVRGANDAASGTVALLRAAQVLGARAKDGWRPASGIAIALWDGEEFGLVGSTEWAEAHAQDLRANLVAYLNMDVGVSGPRFGGADGTPGLLGALRAVLERIPAHDAGSSDAPTTLWGQWQLAAKSDEPALDLPGSGSDFTVFLHHLSLPVLDLGFSGNGGGQYHTAFDDFAQVEAHLDPGFVGHELAGRFMAELLAELAERGSAAFDASEAARALAARARADAAAAHGGHRDPAPLAGALAAVADAFEAASERLKSRPMEGGAFYSALESELPGRPWFKNQLWAPGLELGYGSETFPVLRAAADSGDLAALRARADELVARIARLGG